jgi:isopentenyl-diphosphate delta-isomerase
MEKVILVDTDDNAIGEREKMEAHQLGLLHRAFSVLIFNSKGEMLLQKRAREKYHSGGLWTNACCSHPNPGEPLEQAVQRKLKQEMGIVLAPWFAFKFIYRTDFDNALTEHELDHVFVGTCDSDPSINPEEAEDWRFISLQELKNDVALHPEHYTSWFRIILEHPQFGKIASGYGKLN